MRIRAGQLCTINNNVFRARKRVAGCEGCYFKNCFFTCPGILDKRKNDKKIDCILHGIILVKI